MHSYSDENNIWNNDITDNEVDGVNLSFYNEYNNIYDNTMSNNDDGIHLYYNSDYNNIYDNTVSNNDDTGISTSSMTNHPTILNDIFL